MGIWDVKSWSTDLWHSSYHHGSSAITKGMELSAAALEHVNQHGPAVISKGMEVSADALEKVNQHGSAVLSKGMEFSVDALEKVNQHGPAVISKGMEVSVDALAKVNHHLSDPQTQSKISRIASDVAKNAAIESLKFIPGAYATYTVVSKWIDDDDDKKLKPENESKKQEENLKTLLETVSKVEKEVYVLRQQLAKQAVETKPRDTVEASEKPEGKNPVPFLEDEREE